MALITHSRVSAFSALVSFVSLVCLSFAVGLTKQSDSSFYKTAQMSYLNSAGVETSASTIEGVITAADAEVTAANTAYDDATTAVNALASSSDQTAKDAAVGRQTAAKIIRDAAKHKLDVAKQIQKLVEASKDSFTLHCYDFSPAATTLFRIAFFLTLFQAVMLLFVHTVYTFPRIVLFIDAAGLIAVGILAINFAPLLSHFSPYDAPKVCIPTSNPLSQISILIALAMWFIYILMGLFTAAAQMMSNGPPPPKNAVGNNSGISREELSSGLRSIFGAIERALPPSV